MKKVALIKGDGTGPELVDAMLLVLKASGAKAEFVTCEAGAEWWERRGGESMVPEETWAALEGADCCFKGPTTTLTGPGTPRSVAVSIRTRFDLYANVRPIKTFPNQVGPLGEVDFVMVREGTEGLYAGIEYRLSDDAAVAVRLITKAKSEKVTRFALEEAKRRGWKKLVAVSKANILKLTDGIFLDAARRNLKAFPGVELEEILIDNFSQQLVKNPQRFNQTVIVGTNLFMDILSEEASGLVGSIGMICSANFGDDYAMFEPAHGSTPKYAGKDKVDPTATILSAAWMLEYVGERRAGRAVREATMGVISEGKDVTYDLGGRSGTRGMAQAIAKRLR
ncbi:MAG: isocitrate/isopropylmalate dehydrogenase family protein [Nitrososphaerota archaeon]|nr:isocitrate/isopropylmalate dehydrogenase family protein [Nitrososphaerota archaeon]MDG6967301.1 isocitrate/isopropylmalate dehydrogenase family protein [Nitrososphaerota archaeon]MDG6977932.1 isocitrate/isopropylmalate dehydrogenase family protein [Nitrososphaerota archaeon]MDG7020834.1 isocitrate/isopropylmalate dehydrogenase family protein [Nitrososphaerota archaeon]